MPDKRLYLDNTSLKYGPDELAGFITRTASRALVVGRSWNLGNYPRLNDYFDVVVVEGWESLDILTPTVPDVIVGLAGSVYLSGEYNLNFASQAESSLFLLRWEAAQELNRLGKKTGLRQLAYLSGGAVGTSASEVRSVDAGLALGQEGVHLAKILGVVSIYDTEGRAGTTLVNDSVIAALLADQDIYKTSKSFLGKNRPVLLERI